MGSGPYSIVGDFPECVGKDIYAADCLGDIGSETAMPDGAVDIDDLLAVISGWGACPAPPPVPTAFPIDCSELSPCHADIYPQAYGDNVVNIDDLLAVISGWGNCGGLPEDFPNGIMDCFNIYCDGLTGAAWEECLEKCFEAYCIKYPNDC